MNIGHKLAGEIHHTANKSFKHYCKESVITKSELFSKEYSTEMAALGLIHKIKLDKGKSPLVIFLNLSKAFDIYCIIECGLSGHLSNVLVTLSLCEIQTWGYYHIVKPILAYIIETSFTYQLFVIEEKKF